MFQVLWKIFILGLLQFSLMRCLAKITQKTVLTFYEKEEKWNTYSFHCAFVHTPSAPIFHEKSEEIHNTVNYYIHNLWLLTDKKIWTGLFLEDIATANYQWHRTCEDFDPSVFENFECDSEDCVPQPHDLVSEKLCVAMDHEDNFAWEIHSCLEKARGICAHENGSCTYEYSTTCFNAGTDAFTTRSFNMTLTDCESYCEGYFGNATECWAFSFNVQLNICDVYASKNPYIFEVSNTNCGENWVAYKRRCFEPAMSYYHPEHVDTLLPYSACNTTSNETVVFSNSSYHHDEASFSPTTITSTTTLTSSTTAASRSTSSSTVYTSTESTATTALTNSTTNMPTTYTPTSTTTSSILSSTSLTNPSTTSSTTVTSTAGNTESTSSNPCTCPCGAIITQTIVVNESISALIEKLEQKHYIDKTTLSSYIRKNTCAVDNRPAAKGIGLSVGVGILCILWSIIVIPDLIDCIRYLSKKCKEHEKKYLL